MTNAADLGLARCHMCELVQRLPHGTTEGVCSRCGSAIHLRKPNSLGRTWALLVAAYILYLPANLLPIMESTKLGDAQIDTIMSGIIYLWHEGNWDLAIIVFIASMVVPIGKLLALSWLALSVRFGPPRQRHVRTRMYRTVEFIGRWSMLDIFVAGLLTALVNFNALLMVRVLPGAVAFAAVVVLTMLAAFSFDPRLIWDTRRYDD